MIRASLDPSMLESVLVPCTTLLGYLVLELPGRAGSFASLEPK
jgi:hypothetical protein